MKIKLSKDGKYRYGRFVVEQVASKPPAWRYKTSGRLVVEITTNHLFFPKGLDRRVDKILGQLRELENDTIKEHLRKQK